jgi:hypothetical protein
MSRVMEKIFERVLKESIAQIGLFWFSNDYTRIIRIEGERELTKADLLNSGRIDPTKMHAEYDMPRDTPRGRIYYENKIFQIYVGEDCMIEDEKLINMVKVEFGLKKIDSSRFNIKRHWHWNTKS